MYKGIDLIGQKFGRLSVISETPERYHGQRQFLCKCECGNSKIVPSHALRSGQTKSCGCLAREYHKQSKNLFRVDDLTGKKFGNLIAVECVGRSKHGSALWRCLCDCGGEIITDSQNLKRGHTKSCGCLRYISISNFENMYLKRRKKYEQLTGETVPGDNVVISLDGDITNMDNNNMMSISKQAYQQMQRGNMFFDDPELTKTAALACELSHSVRSKSFKTTHQ